MPEPDVSLGAWRLWGEFAVRGAGFPVDGVLRLAPAGLAEAADSGPTGFADRYARAAADTTVVLRDIARDPAFRSALAWQNRLVLTTGVEPFLRRSPATGSRSSMVRQREELIAHYWQRLCVKNDTIGFFGPVGWGHWDRTVPGVAVDPGRGLISSAEVFFASWAIDGVARVIGADPDVREWIAPRRVPFVRIVDGRVRVPARGPQDISREALAVLDLCDGVRSARAIRRLVGDDIDVTDILADLVRRRFVVWRLEVPADTHPERPLREWLEQVGNPVSRQRGLDRLDMIERGRDRVRDAAGDADRLAEALGELETDFAAMTDEAALRTKTAATPPSRALVYSDARRSARVRLGTPVLDALAPLDLLLTSAAWLTSTLAEKVMDRTRIVFDRLCAADGGPIDLATFWFACMPILHGDAVADAAEIQREFQDRWSDILCPDGARPIRLSDADIRSRVLDVFGKRGPAWTAARYLSPDILIAADDAEAVERGDVTLVLGELHIATNTIGASLFVYQHPAPAELLAHTARDHPGPRLLPMLPKEHRSRLSARIRNALVRDEDYQVALVDFTADPRRPRTVSSADVIVEARGDRLVTVLPDGAVFDAVDVFAHVLTTLVMDLFRVLPDGDHTPRVTVDRMVIAREAWRFAAAALGFAAEKDEARRYLRTRDWFREQGLPRFVFVTAPTEPRPFYVDIDSPVYVNILTKAIRRLARENPDGRLVVTEMLPTPEQAWLTDDAGRVYTSELRFVAVDEG